MLARAQTAGAINIFADCNPVDSQGRLGIGAERDCRAHAFANEDQPRLRMACAQQPDQGAEVGAEPLAAMPTPGLTGTAEAALVEGVSRDPVLGEVRAERLEGLTVIVEAMQTEHDDLRLLGVAPALKGQPIAIGHAGGARHQSRLE